MSEIIKHLKSFNRKERFILLCEVLGYKNQTFRLDSEFRRKLGKCIELTIPPGDNVFVAMDYHLDWIQMALYLADNPKPDCPIPNHDTNRLFEANQRDVDLLVAFEEDKTTHLILVEAKGDTGWTNEQLNKKAKRYARIFDQDRPGSSTVCPHFVMMSPKRSDRIQPKEYWPVWMKRDDGNPRWLCLRLPKGLRKVIRCSKERKNDAKGNHVRIQSVSSKSPKR